MSDHRINERIRAREVRLIDPDGTQLGVKPLPEALSVARQLDLDLVEVAPEANPPVCRIMDYNRFKYEASQRAKESRRKATTTSIKEMKYRPKIGTGDFDTKTRQVAKFLQEGHKVKITIMFRGREMSHPELGKKILDEVAVKVGTVAKVEAAPKLDGRNMIMVLAPDRRAQQAATRTGAPAARGADESHPATPAGAAAASLSVPDGPVGDGAGTVPEAEAPPETGPDPATNGHATDTSLPASEPDTAPSAVPNGPAGEDTHEEP